MEAEKLTPDKLESIPKPDEKPVPESVLPTKSMATEVPKRLLLGTERSKFVKTGFSLD